MTTTVSETATQFSTREVPWMKLGRLVDQPVAAKEAAEFGGLNFSVSLRPVFYGPMTGGDPFKNIEHRRAVVRDDNGEFMGFVSGKMYRSLQYGDAFEFMDTINPTYVAAGTLRGGRQGFMVAKTALTLNVIDGEDPHDLYAVMRTSHDCSRGIEVSVMPLRNRCMNQLTLRTFAKNAEYRWSIKHTTTMAAKLAEAQESLQKIGAYVKRFEEVALKLANTNVKTGKARELLKIVIPQPAGKTERVAEQYAERLNAITDMWTSSPTVAYAGTGWGLVNAVSEYYDWYRAGGTPESRFLNALEGETHKKLNKMAGLLLSGV